MKIYSLPSHISAFLFDMDGTLYTNPVYARLQIDKLVERLAAMLGNSVEKMQGEIAAYREEWAKNHNGQKTSLGNVFTAFGVSIEESVRWREELYEPADYLKTDPKLREVLVTLKRTAMLALVTNNPVMIARKTLAVLGVGDLFSVLVGLDTCLVSKPNDAPFRKAVELLALPYSECISVGNCYDIDLAVPLRLGMTGILVDGVADVYKLPEIVKK
jgi:phosphoglycolate phosphatase/putative hydrolase of the HAD superfamily